MLYAISNEAVRYGVNNMASVKINDMDIQALVDGELDDSEKIQVLKAIHANANLQARYEYIRNQRRLIAAVWYEEERTNLH